MQSVDELAREIMTSHRHSRHCWNELLNSISKGTA